MSVIIWHTDFRYIAPEQLPVRYGGLSKDGEFGITDAVTEITVKPAAKHTVEFPVTEVGSVFLSVLSSFLIGLLNENPGSASSICVSFLGFLYSPYFVTFFYLLYPDLCHKLCWPMPSTVTYASTICQSNICLK